jgi:hypothetical protein
MTMARGRVYTTFMDAVAVSAAQDLFTLQAASGVPIEIHAAALSQKTLAAWEAKEVQFKYVPATVTLTGGTSVTPTAMLPGDAAASATAKINNTTLATSSGTIRNILTDDFNFLNGFYWSPAGDDDRIIIKGGDAFCLRLGTAPSASMTVSGWVSFAELV